MPFGPSSYPPVTIVGPGPLPGSGGELLNQAFKDLITYVNTRAPLASPTFTGTATTPKLAISNGTTSANGIDFGSDVNLYRSAANWLTTDDVFSAYYLKSALNVELGGGIWWSSYGLTLGADATALSPGTGTAVYVSDNDGSNLHQLMASSIAFGATKSACDVNLYRSAANVLKTDDDFVAATVRVTPVGSAPSSPVAGQIYYNSGDNHFYGYNGSSWVRLD